MSSAYLAKALHAAFLKEVDDVFPNGIPHAETKRYLERTGWLFEPHPRGDGLFWYRKGNHAGVVLDGSVVYSDHLARWLDVMGDIMASTNIAPRALLLEIKREILPVRWIKWAHETDDLLEIREEDREFQFRVNGGEWQWVWRDGMNVDCPEDLVWYRRIGELFFKAFRAGYDAGKATEEQVKRIYETSRLYDLRATLAMKKFKEGLSVEEETNLQSLTDQLDQLQIEEE